MPTLKRDLLHTQSISVVHALIFDKHLQQDNMLTLTVSFSFIYTYFIYTYFIYTYSVPRICKGLTLWGPTPTWVVNSSVRTFVRRERGFIIFCVPTRLRGYPTFVCRLYVYEIYLCPTPRPITLAPRALSVRPLQLSSRL